jgi:hypothetical protein
MSLLNSSTASFKVNIPFSIITMSHELHCSKRDVRRKHGRFDNGEILDGLQNIISTFCDEQGALRLKMQAEDDSLLKSYESRILHVETDFGQRIESCKAQQQLLVSALDTSQASLKSLQREIGNIEESIVMCIEAEAELEQGRSNEATMERQKYECIKQDILKERSQKDLILSNRLIEAFVRD